MHVRGLGLGLAALLMLAGCPDAEGEFCAFDDRSKEINNGGEGVGTCESAVIQTECEACMTSPQMPGEVAGEYLFVLSTNIAPALPFIFSADVTVADGQLSMVVIPLAAADRTTPAGSAFTIGPIPLDGGFCINEALPSISVPGDSNGISGAPAEAIVTLVGTVCSPGDFICGTIPEGTAVVGGADLKIAGSTWTLQRLTAPGVFPEPPVINCDMELAAPL